MPSLDPALHLPVWQMLSRGPTSSHHGPPGAMGPPSPARMFLTSRPIILTGVWSMLTEIYGTACNWPSHRRGPCCAAVESQSTARENNRGVMSQAALLEKNTYSCMYEKIYNPNHSLTLFPSFTKIISSRHSSTRTKPHAPPSHNLAKEHKEMTRFVASTWLSALKIDGPLLIGRQARLPDMMTGPHLHSPQRHLQPNRWARLFQPYFSSFNAKQPPRHEPRGVLPKSALRPWHAPPLPIRRTTREPSSVSCQPGCL